MCSWRPMSRLLLLHVAQVFVMVDRHLVSLGTAQQARRFLEGRRSFDSAFSRPCYLALQ